MKDIVIAAISNGEPSIDNLWRFLGLMLITAVIMYVAGRGDRL